MLASELFDRLLRKHPEAVIVRATLEQALPSSFVDEVFERTATGQYTRTLLFSTVVRLLRRYSQKSCSVGAKKSGVSCC